jgi:hypothetical protein
VKVVDFKDLKKICEEHDTIIKNISIIQGATEKRHWISVNTPVEGEFYLGKKEIELLKQYYENRKLELEQHIDNLLNK